MDAHEYLYRLTIFLKIVNEGTGHLYLMHNLDDHFGYGYHRTLLPFYYRMDEMADRLKVIYDNDR